jgi:hypothetical protein
VLAPALHLQQRQQQLTSVRAHQFLTFCESSLLKCLLATTDEVLGSHPAESASSDPHTNTNTHPSVDGQEATDASSSTKDAALSTAATGVAETVGKSSNSGSVVDSSSAPSGPPPSHHRKESIPTTAYPSGTFDSPRAIAPPVGGTAGQAGLTEQHAHKPHKTVQEINEQMRRDSLRVQAAGAFSGGYAAYEGRDRSQERRASQAVTGVGAAATPTAPAASSAAHGTAHEAARGTSPGAPRLSVQEIKERMHRDSLRVQAAGAFSGGIEAYEGRDRSQERRASHVPTAENKSSTGHDAAGAGAIHHEAAGHHKLHKEMPHLFRRIFKRRKNQDTGESEEYSSEEEHDRSGHHETGEHGGTT